ncbi:MAG: hypothetical protein QGG40_00015 [Myxococcota bacterium]|nr:hypothetical protein [Myxococcota bacterium]
MPPTAIDLTRTESTSPDTSLELLHERFRKAQNDLLGVQDELNDLSHAMSLDPLLEDTGDGHKVQLEIERDLAMRAWARTGLAWLLRGGSLNMEPPTEVITDRPPPVRRRRVPATTRPAVERPSPTRTRETTVASPAPSPATTPKTARASSLRPELTAAYSPSEESISGSAALLRKSRATRKPGSPTPLTRKQTAILRDVMETLTEPLIHLSALEPARAELSRLVAGTTGQRLQRWSLLPRELQKALVALVVCRARHLLEVLPDGPVHTDQQRGLRHVFQALKRFAQSESASIVFFGLRPDSRPITESWAADAQQWWGELRRHLTDLAPSERETQAHLLCQLSQRDPSAPMMLEQATRALDAGLDPTDPRLVHTMTAFLDQMRGDDRFADLRRAIRSCLASDVEFEIEVEQSESVEFPHWPYRSAFEGRTVAFVGGTLKSGSRAKRHYQKTFGIREIRWVNPAREGGLSQLEGELARGEIDTVILLRRFCGQEIESELASSCRRVEVPWVSVPGAYGVHGIRQAAEKSLGRRD